MGSSRINISDLWIRITAKDNLLRCPPERDDTFCVKSSNFNLDKICLYWVSKSHALSLSIFSKATWKAFSSLGLFIAFSYSSIAFNVSLSELKMVSSTVKLSSKLSSCDKYSIFMSLRVTTCPLSGLSSPAIIFNMVVFPVPFLAINAIF